MQGNEKDVSSTKNWHTEAFRLFGYKIMSASNHQQIADALLKIDQILDDHGDLEIVVGRQGDMDALLADERSPVITLR